MNAWRYLGLMAIFLLLIGCDATQVSEKTKTMNHLKNKVDGFKWSDNFSSNVIHIVDDENECILRVKAKAKSFNGRHSSLWNKSVNFDKIDPNRISINVDGVVTPAIKIEGENIAINKGLVDGEDRMYISDYMYLFTSDAESAYIVRDALIHMISLCKKNNNITSSFDTNQVSSMHKPKNRQASSYQEKHNDISYDEINVYKGAGNTTTVLKCSNGSTQRIHAMDDNPNNPYGGYRSKHEEALRVCRQII